MLVGHVFNLLSEAAFLPLLLGNANFAPGQYAPSVGVTVTANFLLERYLPPSQPKGIPLQKLPPKPTHPTDALSIQYWASSSKTATDGSFSLTLPPASVVKKDGAIKGVALTVSSGNQIIYRTGLFSVPTHPKNLDMYILSVPSQPAKPNVTAGFMASQLGAFDLPGDTTITVGMPYGMNFKASSSGVDLNFNLVIKPDTSSDLGSIVDLYLNGYNINVGFPADLGTDALSVLYKLENAIDTVGMAAVNGGIMNVMETTLTQYGIRYAAISTWCERYMELERV